MYQGRSPVQVPNNFSTILTRDVSSIAGTMRHPDYSYSVQVYATCPTIKW